MPSPDANSPPIPPRTPSALIVDDDEPMRKLLNLALTQHGFQVHQAAEGREAITLFERLAEEIDVVVLDVRMPGCGGPETLAALRRLNPNVRAVFVTGYTGDIEEEDLLAQGAARVFYKPFPLIEFAEYLQRLAATE
jgi:CheY-like chemotaxis protein